MNIEKWTMKKLIMKYGRFTLPQFHPQLLQIILEAS